MRRPASGFIRFEESTMTSLERLTGRITSRIGLIVVFAILLLAVSSTAGRDAIDAGVTMLGTAAAPVLSGDTSIRPFKFKASNEALMDLRRRVAGTKWPDRETVTDTTQGVQLATMQQLARYWGKEYDWRKARRS
jgi:hypothetical protein